MPDLVPRAEPLSRDRDTGLIALATRRPVAVTMVVLTVMVFGAIALERLPRDLMPNIAYPSITVRTEYPGASPEDVEMRVSRRLEEMLSQVRGLRRISSISRAGVSDVILEFAWGTSMTFASMEAHEKVAQAILPDGLPRPTVLRYDPTLDPILQIGVFREEDAAAGESSQERLIELRLLAEDVLERELESVDGVAAVQVRGGLEREIRIEVAEAQLRSRGLTTALLNQRLAEENLNQASGQLYEGDQSYVVRTVNELADIEEIGDIILRPESAGELRLRDVAAISWSYAEPEVITRIDGKPCVKVEIYREPEANIVDVARRVRDRLFGTSEERQRLEEILRTEREMAVDPVKRAAELERRRAAEAGKQGGGQRRGWSRGPVPGLSFEGAAEARPDFLASRLPPGHELRVMSDQSIFIQTSLADVISTGISGGILSVVILLLFLRRLWFTMAVNLSVPISVAATFLCMHIFGVSLNMMSLGGLALGIGMLVDNSIVVLEGIFRSREEGNAPRAAAVIGTQTVAGAVIASTCTSIAVFFPIVFVEGVAGQMFRDQALTVVISLAASLLVALYVIPVCVGRTEAARFVEDASRQRPQVRFDAGRELAVRLRALPRRGWRLLLAPFLAAFFLVTAVVRGLLQGLGIALLAVVAGLRAVAQAAGRLFRAGGSGPVVRLLDAWERGFEATKRGYERLLRASLRRRALVIAAAAAAVVISTWSFGRLGSELVPEVHQGEFTIDVRLPVGTRLLRSDAVLRPIEAKLLAAAAAGGVESVTTTIGVQKDDVRAGDEGEHTAKLLVRLKPGGNLLAVEEDVKRRFREVLESEAELSSHKFQNPVLFTFKTPIEVEVKGHELKELRRVTTAIEDELRADPQLRDVKSSIRSGYPEVHLRLDRELMARFGLTAKSVGDVLRQKIQGDVASYFNEGDRRVAMRVRLVEEDRRSLEDLAGLIVNPGSPAPVRLADIVPGGKLEVSEGPSEIRRINQQRAGVVSANTSGIDLGNVTAGVRAALGRVDAPPSFLVGFGGQKEEMDASLRSLVNALVLAMFLVYVVMAMQFESLLQPLIIILALPLAMVGVGPVLWALDAPVNILVFIGMIVLAGIVVNNAIVLIDHVNQVRAGGLELTEALVDAGKTRLRPILLTTLTTVLGLVPLTGVGSGIPVLEWVFGSGEGVEVRAPLALTIIGGLSASTVLTLLVVPVVYSFLPGKARRSSETEQPA